MTDEEILERVILKTAKLTNLDVKTVKNIIDFQSKRFAELIETHQEHDILQVKIKHICKFEFKQQYYDKHMEKKIEKDNAINKN